MHLNNPKTIPIHLVYGKTVFHGTGPRCQAADHCPSKWKQAGVVVKTRGCGRSMFVHQLCAHYVTWGKYLPF